MAKWLNDYTKGSATAGNRPNIVGEREGMIWALGKNERLQTMLENQCKLSTKPIILLYNSAQFLQQLNVYNTTWTTQTGIGREWK